MKIKLENILNILPKKYKDWYLTLSIFDNWEWGIYYLCNDWFLQQDNEYNEVVGYWKTPIKAIENLISKNILINN
jgi:hypothetical protein